MLGLLAVGVVWLAAGALAQARDQTGRPQVGDQAANFELESLDGEKVKLSKLQFAKLSITHGGQEVLRALRGE